MFSLIPKYGYANARTKAMKSKLLGESKLNELLAVNSIEEVIELLEESVYQAEMVEFSTKYTGIELVNRAVDANFIKTVKKIASYVPKSSAGLLNLVLEEWTVQNLKAIIASKATGMALSESSLILINSEQEKLYNAVKEQSMDLRKTMRKIATMNYAISPLFKQIEGKYFSKNEMQDFRILFKELDNYYYSKLVNASESEKDASVSALLAAKVNFINTMSVLRLKLAGVSAKEITQNVIATKHHNKHETQHLIEKEDVYSAVEEVVKKHKLPQNVTEQFKQTNSLVKLEVELERTLMQKALKTSKVSVLSFAVILAYVYLKQEECAFIKAIAYSTQAGIREEVKALVLPVKA